MLNNLGRQERTPITTRGLRIGYGTRNVPAVPFDAHGPVAREAGAARKLPSKPLTVACAARRWAATH